VERKAQTETRENVYVMTQISREPRQIVSFAVGDDKSAAILQGLVDRTIQAQNYATDGNLSYLDVDFYGSKHIRNVKNKKDTHNIESVNADLRHYISGLSRRSRCFFRKIDTIKAVLNVYINAYNRFGEYKLFNRKPVIHKQTTTTKHLHKFRDTPLYLFDFL